MWSYPGSLCFHGDTVVQNDESSIGSVREDNRVKTKGSDPYCRNSCYEDLLLLSQPLRNCMGAVWSDLLLHSKGLESTFIVILQNPSDNQDFFRLAEVHH